MLPAGRDAAAVGMPSRVPQGYHWAPFFELETAAWAAETLGFNFRMQIRAPGKCGRSQRGLWHRSALAAAAAEGSAGVMGLGR